MAVGNRLFALAEQEFAKTRTTPRKAKFKGLNLNVSRFDESWDRKRGTAVRMMSVILRENDQELLARVSTNGGTGKTYQEAAQWFRREAEHLRKVAGMMDNAADRLVVVLERREALTQN